MVQRTEHLDTTTHERQAVLHAELAPPARDGDHGIQPAGVAKGALAGAVAGMAGAAAMAMLMKGASKLGPGPVKEEARAMKSSMDETRLEFVEENLDVHPDDGKAASMAVHFATGAIGGALYGAAAEIDERVTIGHGAAYGVAFWAASTMVALPALGLSPPPTQVPLKSHAKALGMHVMYGMAVESARKPLRGAMG